MIKRRFFKQEHVDKNGDSDSSSSSSDSEAEAQEEDEEETAEEVEAVADVKEDQEPDFPEPGKMSASSSSANHDKSSYLKYVNKYCYYNKRAVVRISQSTNNPYRLLYCCLDSSKQGNVVTRCGFFLWAVRINEQRVMSMSTNEDGSNSYKELGETSSVVQASNDEFRKLKNKVNRLAKKSDRDETQKAVLQAIVVGLVLAVIMLMVKQMN